MGLPEPLTRWTPRPRLARGPRTAARPTAPSLLAASRRIRPAAGTGHPLQRPVDTVVLPRLLDA
ncbi:hypothetical protein [Streptomyces sp. NPDC050264]|uniref:hypothetical protein n=1 Tax=Streptomyces sp. NPDC050264 TaxID=3155038 RepID=UPI00341664C8